MKGVDSLIASVLIILISITAVFLALQYGKPSTDKAKEILLMQEGKNNLLNIDATVKNVVSEGEGSTRALKIAVSGGSYVIDDDSVSFTMESRAQLLADGITKTEDGINMTGSPSIVYMLLDYDEYALVGGGEFGRGQRTLTVRNDGFNSTTQKQMIYISTSP
jgi:hypothetical protein